MKHLEVVAAIVIDDDKKILCMQRGPSKYEYISNKYEFPGGKIEKNESNVNALKREIKEELNIDITVENEFLTVEYSYPDFMITMHTYICKTLDKQISLNAHIDYLWLDKFDLENLDWAEADIPIVKKLINEF